MIPRMPDRQYAYFRDDQITFYVTHPQFDVLDESRIKTWQTELERELRDLLKVELGPTVKGDSRWFSFRRLRDHEYNPPGQSGAKVPDPFSIITCEMENVPLDPLEFLKLITRLKRPYVPRPSNPEHAPLEPDPRNEAGLIGFKAGEIEVQEVTLNWIASSASQSGGTGGPGGWPVPYRGNPSRVPYQFRDLIRRLKGQDKDKDPGPNIYGDGANVDVLILDTAPCPHDLVAAYKECKSWHPLIRTLLGPNGKLKLYPATYDENLQMGSTSLNNHDYKMTDHGLFSAGIIHSIVPQATIHLIEVLSPLGVSDLHTLTGGLQKAYEICTKQMALGRKVVINCSWMLDLPIVEAHLQTLSYTDPEYVFERAVWNLVMSDPGEAKSARALHSQCALLGFMGVDVIAAAGNDWKQRGARSTAPATRYPAAFLNTYGVGALPKDLKRDLEGKNEASTYSNIADVPNKPEIRRIVTLGGEEGEERGVLGLYIGEFPGCDPEPNCTKWAWWSGTSFATPILTGAVAAVLSSRSGPNTTEDAVNKLFATPPGQAIIRRNGTKANEAVMEVSQEC